MRDDHAHASCDHRAPEVVPRDMTMLAEEPDHRAYEHTEPENQHQRVIHEPGAIVIQVHCRERENPDDRKHIQNDSIHLPDKICFLIMAGFIRY